MTESIATTLRKRIIAVLTASEPEGVSWHISDNRSTPQSDSQLPALHVYALSGSEDCIAANAAIFDCQLILAVDITVSGASDSAMGTTLSDLIEAVKDAIKIDETLISTARLAAINWDSEQVPAEGRRRLQGAQVRFTYEYRSESDYSYAKDLSAINATINYSGHVAAEIEADLAATEEA